jgi:RNA polymerase sigma-70 factor (ECF subfamily)
MRRYGVTAAADAANGQVDAVSGASMALLTAAGTWAIDDGPVPSPDHLYTVPADTTSPSEQAERQRAAWMAAAQSGDRRAYERVLADVLPLVRAVARRQGVAPDSIDDVVQETLLTVHRVRHTYDPARSFDAWLAAIAARRAIDALRSQGRRGRREVHDELALDQHADRDDASADSEQAQEAARLRAAIASLPPGQREAVEELGLKEHSLAEAAQRTGRNTGALKVNLHRALKALRGRLNGES